MFWKNRIQILKIKNNTFSAQAKENNYSNYSKTYDQKRTRFFPNFQTSTMCFLLVLMLKHEAMASIRVQLGLPVHGGEEGWKLHLKLWFGDAHGNSC